MWQRNKGQTEAEKLQNRFTAYLLVAVRREQRDYIKKKNQQIKFETLMEDDTYQYSDDDKTELMNELPLMMQLESTSLQYALGRISDRERYVFMNRVLNDIDFEDLGMELGLGYKGAAAIYYRTIRKLKKIMKEDD